MQVIGTVEGATIPSFSRTLLTDATMEGAPAEVAFVPAALPEPLPSGLYEKNEASEEVPEIQPSSLSGNHGHSRIALILATGTLFAVVAKTAWHRFQPTAASKTETVSTPVQVAENQPKDLAVAGETNATPINGSVPAPIQSNLDAASRNPDMVAPSSPAPMVSDPRPAVVTPAAINSPLGPTATEPTSIKHTPTTVSGNKSGSKENSSLIVLQGGKTEEEMLRIQVSGPPRKLIYPDYPNTSVRGKVSLEAVIGADGRVREVKILSGNKVLSAAAVRAIRKWRYDPFYKDGQRVETETNVAMLFVADDVISISFPQPLASVSQ
jgi:TonB family protein